MASFDQIMQGVWRRALTLILVILLVILAIMTIVILVTRQVTFGEAVPMIMFTMLSFQIYMYNKKSGELQGKDKIIIAVGTAFMICLAAGVFLSNRKANICADMNAPPDRAIEACASIIHSEHTAKADLAAALSSRGMAYTRNNQNDLAIKDYDRALDLNPNSLPAFANRGVAHMKLKQFDLAIEDFTQALRIDPHHAAVLGDRGIAYKNNGQYDLALQDLNEAILNGPNLINARTNRGMLYLAQKDYDKALQDADDVLQNDPTNIAAFVLRGTIKFEVRDYDESIQDYDLALKLAANNFAVVPSILALRAAANLNKGQYDAARKDLEEAFRMDPQNASVLTVRGSVLISQDDFVNGIADLDQANNFDPDDAQLLFTRGVAKLYNAMPNAAIDDLVASVRLKSAGENKALRIIWLHLARLRAGQNDQLEFGRNSALPLPDAWPAPLLELYRGSATVDEVTAKAKIGDTAAAVRNQACDVDFYLGEFYLLNEQKDSAKELLQAANDDCTNDEIEHTAARAELKAMGN